MSELFFSYVEEDGAVVAALARGLEAAGYATWFYQRDSLPGPSYLEQVGAAIDRARAVVLVISRQSLASRQVTAEVVRAYEGGKPFVPLLLGVSHAEFQRRQSEWRGALAAATSMALTPGEAADAVPRIVQGLRRLGVEPAAPAPAEPVPRDWTTVGDLRVSLRTAFDRTTYQEGADPVAQFLLELEVQPADRGRPGGVRADVCLVLDVSGSMNRPDRYPLLRQAVERLLASLPPDDRVGVVLFSTDGDVVMRLTDGRDVPSLLARMDESPIMFGGNTCLAPGLDHAGRLLAAVADGHAAQRVYVLTDGQIHDPEDCRRQLAGLPSRGVEVHAYGFGVDFEADALKRLVSDQLGGTVKPIVNEEAVVKTFGHIAKLADRLVAKAGVLTVDFEPDVDCGDAWEFRPKERWLKAVRHRRISHELGGLEAGRTYALLAEVRLPPARGRATPVGRATLHWHDAGGRRQVSVPVAVPRGPGGRPDESVRRAFTLLDALRRPDDPQLRLAALKARRELAVLERRSASLVAALDKEIARLEGRSDEPQRSEADEQLLKADSRTTSMKLSLPDPGLP